MNATALAGDRQEAALDNVDPLEVGRYAELAATWWDRQGPFWPLHRLNALRVDYLCDTLALSFARDASSERPLEGLDVLDVGCGGGILSESMAHLGANVHGIDVVQRNIVIAHKHAAASALDVHYEQVTVGDVAARGDHYDVVLNMEVVEHVPDMPAFMADCTRLVRPGGAMVVATINRTPKSFLFAIVGAEYLLRWLPRGTHRWDRFVKPAEIESLLEHDGLHVVCRRGVRINPITRSFSLVRDLSVNFMIYATRKAVA